MIVLTAPTSDIGQQVLTRLLEANAPVRIIARDPSRLADDMRSRVQIVQGSHSDTEVVNRAFFDAEAVFWLLPPNPHAESLEAAFVDFARPAAAALKAHKVKRVVSISALGRGTPFDKTAGHVTASLAMDDLLASTGVALRTLTMPSFMDNIARQAGAIKCQGLLSSPISGDLKMPSCATRDIAAVAGHWLLNGDWSGQKDVAVLGAADISFNEMTKIISEVFDIQMRFEQVGFADYKARFLRHGFSEAMAQGMRDMMFAKNEGLDLGIRRTPKNTTSTTFRQWCEDVLKPAMQD
ncbi:NAD(P)H-binding protein [Dyella mobilis]|uniref:NAD(P)H-binding protein n=1 Tax=Dyella mobilis TaxID=1849582 RepID=A0ABS2KCJ5_9GAMM|nr:NAD(P)H-binding protein [Dyella mobilis]MBM7128659.1 NAD(P)H-binding protein [Dyella mobilis]GLQ98981.1 NmrA family transcriptional regulator [Dyella mobilis]